MTKRALITGVTGQDGAYLAELLLEKGYEVHGIKRRSSSFNTERVNHLFHDPHEKGIRFILHYGDLTDGTNLLHIVERVRPDEIYNLGAQSHVQVSFESAEYTANVNALGTLRLLEAVRLLGGEKEIRFYQASTSEMFGKAQETPQRESTPFYPRSPYACSKLFSYWTVVNYRESYGMYACNGILFNHESPRRGETFVTRKITRAVARIKLGLQEKVFLGNLDAKRDWGFAGEYVNLMWLMLQQKEPRDYVVGTGRTTTVRDFVTMAFSQAGIALQWSGRGTEEVAKDPKTGKVRVEVDPRYFRPAEVDLLLADASAAKRDLGWNPTVSLEQIVHMMVESDIEEAEREVHLRNGGFKTSHIGE